jgi:hypothetical protein
MDTTCGYRGCARPAGVLIGYWVLEEHAFAPRLAGNHLSCEEHAAEVAAEAYGGRLVPDSAGSESLVVVDDRISPNKVLVYRLKEDSFMRAPKSHVQEKVYEKLKLKAIA